MILNSDQINAMSAMAIGGLISPFVPSNVRRSSYDLTVGDEYYCGANGASRSTGPISTHRLPPGRTFVVPAHGICFILCAEKITLPPSVTGRVALRMPFVYRGLVLTAQPPFDPGYVGKVIVMVHNLSSSDIAIKQGERLVTIEFSEVTPNSTINTVPHSSVTDLASRLSSPVKGSLIAMESSVISAKRKVNWLIGQLATIIAALLALQALASWASYSFFTDKIAEIKSKCEKLDDIVAKQTAYIDELSKKLEKRK